MEKVSTRAIPIIDTRLDRAAQPPDNALIHAKLMPAVLDDDRSKHSVFSLWTAYSVGGGWYHLETDTNKSALESKVKSLKTLFTSQRFLIVPGASSPK
jgi:hypothetical protein